MINRQKGDTIVEVLLAMAVVGMVLGSSFGIANRSLNIGRSAQERTQALKIAESQLELMKLSEEINNGSISGKSEGNNFCLTTSGSNINVLSDTAPSCKDIDGSGGDGLYSISIIPKGSNSLKVYEIKITWERLGASNTNLEDRQDKLSLFYKLGTL